MKNLSLKTICIIFTSVCLVNSAVGNSGENSFYRVAQGLKDSGVLSPWKVGNSGTFFYYKSGVVAIIDASPESGVANSYVVKFITPLAIKDLKNPNGFLSAKPIFKNGIEISGISENNEGHLKGRATIEALYQKESSISNEEAVKQILTSITTSLSALVKYGKIELSDNFTQAFRKHKSIGFVSGKDGFVTFKYAENFVICGTSEGLLTCLYYIKKENPQELLQKIEKSPFYQQKNERLTFNRVEIKQDESGPQVLMSAQIFIKDSSCDEIANIIVEQISKCAKSLGLEAVQKQPDFASIIAEERKSNSLADIFSANLLEVSSSLSLSNQYAFDKDRGTHPPSPPEFRAELEPIRYLAMDPKQALGGGQYVPGIAKTLIGLSDYDVGINYLTKNYETLLSGGYTQEQIENYMQRDLTVRAGKAVTVALDDTKEIIRFAAKSPETKNHDMAGGLTGLIAMTLLTSINERNAALGRDVDTFPLKNYFPQYFKTTERNEQKQGR